MISLRAVFTNTLVAATALVIAGCGNDATAPTRSLKPSAANLDGKVGDVGNARKNGVIDVSVVLDKYRNATIEVHTGTFDDIAAMPHPNGYFESIQYKVYDATGRQKLVRNVTFKKTTPNVFIEAIPLCKDTDDSDDDASGADNDCAVKFLDGWTVSVQANLKGVNGDGSKTDVVRTDGYVMWAPDVDMVPAPITFLTGAPLSALAPNALTNFRVLIPNNKPTPIALGVVATCAIFIDGARQTVGNANGFAYLNGSTFSIGVNGFGDCEFQAKLSAGAHTLQAAAEGILPDDYDYSNNRTAIYTVSSIASPPDVDALNQLFTINGAANTPATTVGTGALVQLGQNVKLVAGTPPGTVTCAMTVAPGTGVTPSSATTTTSLVANGAQGLCSFPATFSQAGDYVVTTVVSLPAGVTDANPANNTATATVHVIPAPIATVSLNPIQYSDPKLNVVLGKSPTDITSDLGATAAEDSVHNGDVATFSAPISATIQNFTGTITAACSATINGQPASSFAGFAWITQTITLPTTGTPSCKFTLPFNDTNFSTASGLPFTVTFSVALSGLPNSAPVSAQTVTGALTEFVRADVSADPFQVTIGTVTTPLSGTGVKQSSTVAIQTVLHNPSNVATSMDCGQLYVDVAPPIGFAIPTAADTIPSALSPTKVTASVAVPAGGTGVCRYTLAAPSNLGLISIKLIQMTTTTAGNNPKDPNPLNNAATGVFTIISDGTFTVVPNPVTDPNAISAEQLWYLPTTDPAAASGGLLSTSQVPDAATLDKRGINAKDLALLVIRTADVLGTFELSGTLYNGVSAVGTPQPLGTLTVLRDSLRTTGVACVSAPGGSTMTSAAGSSLTASQLATFVYTADICARPKLDQPGFTQVIINVAQSLGGQQAGTTHPVLFNPGVTLKLSLKFRLLNATIDDQVTATVAIPIDQLSDGCLTAFGKATCQSTWKQYTVATP